MPTAVHAIFKLPDGGASIPIYTSTKAAVTDAARSLAGAYGDQNIRAYSVNPAFFETALVSEGGKQFMPDSAQPKCRSHKISLDLRIFCFSCSRSERAQCRRTPSSATSGG